MPLSVHATIAFTLALLGAPVAAARQLPAQFYTSLHGLPRNTAGCLTPGSNGVLWICTSEGLVRFDGREFRVFGPERGLPSRHVADFVVSRHGGFWLVTEEGVCRIPAESRSGDPCRLLAIDARKGEFQADCLIESSTGTVWVATNRALYRVSSGGGKLIHAQLDLTGLEIQSLAEGPDGNLLLGTTNGLRAWREGAKARPLTRSDAQFGVNQMVVEGARIWMATSVGLYRLD